MATEDFDCIQFDPTEITIVKPTTQEIEEGVAKLKACLPYWMETPAALTIKPDLALIVSVAQAEHDDEGFTLLLDVRERLAAPASFTNTQTAVSCGWNQPYMSFHQAGINAPYSFSLDFGVAGVARARKRQQAVLPSGHGAQEEVRRLLNDISWCFVPGNPREYPE